MLVEPAEGLHGHQPHGLFDDGATFESVRDQCSGQTLTDAEGLVVVVVASATFACRARAPEPGDLLVVRIGVVVDATDARPVERLENHEGAAAEVTREGIECFGERRARHRGVSRLQICPWHQDFGSHCVAPALDLGLSLGAGVLIADAASAAPDVGELVGQGEDLAVEGLVGVDEHERRDVIDQREPPELVLVERSPGVVVHHGGGNGQAAEGLEVPQ